MKKIKTVSGNTIFVDDSEKACSQFSQFKQLKPNQKIRHGDEIGQVVGVGKSLETKGVVMWFIFEDDRGKASFLTKLEVLTKLETELL